MKNLIENNQNITGGGNAQNVTGLYESNRNALAKLDATKRSAGDVAKSLRERGLKMTASEIKEFCEEWHHAGAYKGKMGKAYYTVKSDFQILNEFHRFEIIEKRRKAEKKELDKLNKRKKTRGVYFSWQEGGRKKYKRLDSTKEAYTMLL